MNTAVVPRIPPLPEGERTARQQEVIDDLVQGPTVNVYTTLARDPEAAAALVNFGRTLRAGALSPRHREILILRTGWNCNSAYEFGQHRIVALSVGMTLDEIRRIQAGPDAPGWDPFEALLLRAADELHHDNAITDATWAGLTEGYNEQQLMEAVLFVGYYHLISFALNAFGVPLEPGTEAFLTD